MNKIDSSFQAYLQSELPDLQQDQTFERLKFNGENKAGLLFSEMPFQMILIVKVSNGTTTLRH